MYLQRTISLTPDRSAGQRIDIPNTGGLHVARLTAPEGVLVQVAFDETGDNPEIGRVTLRPGRTFIKCFKRLTLFHPATTGEVELISFSQGEGINDAGAGAGVLLPIRSNDGTDQLRAVARRLDEGLPAATMAFGGGSEPTAIYEFRYGDAERFYNAMVAAMRMYFPDASGTDGDGSRVNFDAPRGRGAGVPGTFYFRTSSSGASGAALQAIADALSIRGDKIVAHKPLELLAGMIGGSSTPTERTSAVLQLIKRANVATIAGVGMADPALTGAVNLDGNWGRLCGFDTTAVLNNAAGINSGSVVLGRFDFNGDHTIRVRTSSSITLLRLWSGLSTAALSTKDTPTTESVAAFRFSTSAGDANWQAVTHDGSGGAPTVTNTGVVVAVTTVYRFRIVRLASGNVEFYINDALVATHTTTLPAGAPISWLIHSVTTLSAAIRTFSFSRSAHIFADI